ncbi:MAG: HAD family hydrolase [Acetivibrio sp.]
MTDKKIIFFDIDGTIIEEDTYMISESTMKAIQNTRKNGHFVIINTGRTNFMIDKELKEKIGFDGYLLGCGTEIIFREKVLMHQSLPLSLTKTVIEQLRKCRIDGVLEGSKKDYVDYPENMHTKHFRDFVCNMARKQGNWEDENLEIDKLFVCENENSDMNSFRKILEGELDFIDRENGYWEIVPKGYSKASGMEYLMNYLKMPIEATVAVGDSNNDLSMLEYAHISIAMGNATKGVQDMATYVTSDVHEDGIEKAMKWIGVIS